MDSAVAKFCEIVRLENNIPAVDLAIQPEALARSLHVEADAGCAPHVVDSVLIAWVVSRETACNFWPDISKILKFGPIKFLKDPGLDLPFEEVTGRNDHVVTRFPGEKFGLECLVGIEGVVLHLYAGFLREILEDFRLDILCPFLVIDHALVRVR